MPCKDLKIFLWQSAYLIRDTFIYDPVVIELMMQSLLPRLYSYVLGDIHGNKTSSLECQIMEFCFMQLFTDDFTMETWYINTDRFKYFATVTLHMIDFPSIIYKF